MRPANRDVHLIGSTLFLGEQLVIVFQRACGGCEYGCRFAMAQKALNGINLGIRVTRTLENRIES
jgi:hypothetical protein